MTRSEILAEAKPITFTPEMVRAILDGRKSQTRRVIKPNVPGLELWEMDNSHTPYVMDSYGPHHPRYVRKTPGFDYRGQLLYVRETFTRFGNNYYHKASCIKCNADSVVRCSTCIHETGQVKWMPSIHMPKSAARLFLRVTGVRAERLNSISARDSKDEGIKVWGDGCIDGLAFGCYNWEKCFYDTCERPIELYHELWDTIYAKKDGGAYAWDKNPWVFVYCFEKVEVTG